MVWLFKNLGSSYLFIRLHLGPGRDPSRPEGRQTGVGRFVTADGAVRRRPAGPQEASLGSRSGGRGAGRERWACHLLTIGREVQLG